MVFRYPLASKARYDGTATKSMTAIVLPYAALGANSRFIVRRTNLSQPACMIETGIVNILGTLRTDTPYNPKMKKSKTLPNARMAFHASKSSWQLSSFSTQIAGAKVELQARKFGTEPPQAPYGANYGGYVITDGSTYAPQMPWYMAHYCDPPFPDNTDAQDPVCYADYFSPMNDGFNLLPVHRCKRTGRSQRPGRCIHLRHLRHTQPLQPGADSVHAGYGGVQSRPSAEHLYQPSVLEIQQLFVDRGSMRHWQTFRITLARLIFNDIFPGVEIRLRWENFLYPQAVNNPFLGTFPFKQTDPPNRLTGCDVTLTGPVPSNCTKYREPTSDHLPLPQTMHACRFGRGKRSEVTPMRPQL